MIDYESSPVGRNLTEAANAFGATEIRHLGGRKFEAIRADGQSLRMLADEGIGSTENEDGFEAAWADAEK